MKCDGTRCRTRGEVKGKLANGVGSQYSSHYLGTWYIQHYYCLCAHLGCQQSTELTAPADLNGLVRFARKTKSGFCTCAVTFQVQSSVILMLFSALLSALLPATSLIHHAQMCIQAAGRHTVQLSTTCTKQLSEDTISLVLSDPSSRYSTTLTGKIFMKFLVGYFC